MIYSECINKNNSELPDLKELKEKGIIIARYTYEHNDGDQIWNNYYTYIKYNNEFYLHSENGYCFTDLLEKVDSKYIKDDMKNIEVSISKQSSEYRGGYSIYKPLDLSSLEISSDLISKEELKEFIKDNICSYDHVNNTFLYIKDGVWCNLLEDFNGYKKEINNELDNDIIEK